MPPKTNSFCWQMRVAAIVVTRAPERSACKCKSVIDSDSWRPVCHYPTGCSKWNPIERRLFRQISCNWAGVLLRTSDTLLAFIRGTNTSRGLAVTAVLQPGEYPTGQKITDAEMAALNLEHHAVCPTWNYTIRPRTPACR